ncbi:S8 family peptidase [Goodfellowiella coeruleoviolacea]|uniref:Peptidase inhibitor I9 n=1 Tax=Goodfellowiella coeruleoviolacea TaxID=334858 RepID=A0AAE3GEF2_9PSEU|nr:S8 family peptidase [Goodfellowiella coeruleoviolacea]MCP2165819.1 Peptidase inhibitor I9 [Goodfellowiella coeruleoviolacea]
MGEVRAPRSAGWPRRTTWLGLTAAAAACVLTSTVATPVSAAAEGDVLGTGTITAIPGSYLVVLKNDDGLLSGGTPLDQAVSLLAESLGDQYGAQVRRTYHSALTGFSAWTSDTAARRLAADPRVKFVAQNQMLTVQDVGSWGLDRVDQRTLPLDAAYVPANSGAGVNAYVIDTGIRVDHQSFGGRAVSEYDAVDNDTNADDCHGHGTHVAGTIGGNEWGVARSVRLHAVRVLDCDGSGTTEEVVDGIDWVTEHAQLPAVANLSLGGGADPALDEAVRGSINAGVVYSVAAGNGDIFGFPQNACAASPARVTEAITVSATNRSDMRAMWANYGPCVDVFAPGVDITSAWIDSDTDSTTLSGTSMAAPHATGAAAIYLSEHPTATPAEVSAELAAAATPNVVGNAGLGSLNRLLYVGPQA